MHLSLGSDEHLDLLLNLLESRAQDNLPTIILSDVYPLEAITHPDQYPEFHKQQNGPDPTKTNRWIRLLKMLVPRYWPTPITSELDDILARETAAFSDLYKLTDEIKASPLWNNGNLAEAEVVELVRQYGRSFYTSLWRLCTKKERVLLYRLAQGYLVNPAMAGDLTHLLERGLLRRDPIIRLPNGSFKQFIMAVESPECFEEWMGDVRASAWSVVRIPLIALIFVLSATVAYMGKETSNYVIALLGSATAIPPLLFRLFGSGLLIGRKAAE